MARVFVNTNNFDCYLLITTSSFISLYDIYTISANSTLSTDDIDSIYTSGSYVAIICTDNINYNLLGTSVSTSSTATPTFNYYLHPMGGVFNYNDVDYYSFFATNFILTASNYVYFSFSQTSEYTNVLPDDIVDNAVTTYHRDNYRQLAYLLDATYDSITTTLSLYAKITPNTGYYFNGTITLTVTYNGSTTLTMATDNVSNVSETQTTSSATMTSPTIINSVVLTSGNLVKKTFTISDTHVLNSTLSYVGESDDLLRGSTVNFTLTCNSGYVFSSDAIPYIRDYVTDGYTTTYFTLSDDLQTATLTYTTTADTLSIQVYSEPVLSSDIPTTSYDFVNVYSVTNDNLKEIATKRFYVTTASSPANLIDLAQYVNSLKRFYCDVPVNADVTQNVVMGNVDTGVSCQLISSDFVEIDCGTHEIVSTNNNSNDYNNNVYAILPFVGNVSLNADVVMNRNINIKYRVSCLTGSCVAMIIDADNDIILDTFSGSIAENVPYILNNILWELQGNFDSSSMALYGFIPTIVVAYHANYNETEFHNDNTYGLLSNISKGQCVVNDIIINDNSINENERNMIIDELRNGVIFDT